MEKWEGIGSNELPFGESFLAGLHHALPKDPGDHTQYNQKHGRNYHHFWPKLYALRFFFKETH
jgi:hypothetical protein